MLIGQAVLMTGGLQEVLEYSWDLISYLGVLENRLLCQDQALKLSTSPWPMLLQN